MEDFGQRARMRMVLKSGDVNGGSRGSEDPLGCPLLERIDRWLVDRRDIDSFPPQF